MINENSEENAILLQLADRLKEARLARNESQEVFAARLGITRQSYSKMEKGIASVPIGYWLSASKILGRLQSWQTVLEERENLFARFDRQTTKRKRAGGRRGRIK